MGWFRCLDNNGGGPSITFKNYMKFNGEGLELPLTIDSDHKIEVVFYDVSYNNDSAVIGNTQGSTLLHLTEYSNKYYCSVGTAEGNFGAWSSGEHTFICNNGNNHNEFDGVEVTAYTPTTANHKYTIGCRGNVRGNAYYGYIKSYKIYSISSGNLLHNYRPCQVLNLSCLYDEIDELLYTNASMEAVDVIS